MSDVGCWLQRSRSDLCDVEQFGGESPRSGTVHRGTWSDRTDTQRLPRRLRWLPTLRARSTLTRFSFLLAQEGQASTGAAAARAIFWRAAGRSLRLPAPPPSAARRKYPCSGPGNRGREKLLFSVDLLVGSCGFTRARKTLWCSISKSAPKSRQSSPTVSHAMRANGQHLLYVALADMLDVGFGQLREQQIVAQAAGPDRRCSALCAARRTSPPNAAAP